MWPERAKIRDGVSMIVRVIGGHGGISPGFKATSYLIDGKLLIDAGSCAGGIHIDEQVHIDHILISHPHLDHIKDLAFICDNCFGLKGVPFEVYSHKTVIKAIKDHLMNDLIWPDFSKLPSKSHPTMRFHEISEKNVLELGEYKVTPIHVNHPGDAFGFIVEKGNTAVVFTQDTGPTDEIWTESLKNKKIKGIFTEVSFPNMMQQVATDSQHHTPNTLFQEVKKMPKEIPIFVGHLKPNYQTQLMQEIEDLGIDRITLLTSDDSSFVL